MRRLRFTISSLLVVVLFLAVGFAALRESNDLWDSGIFTATLGVLLVSLLLSIHRTEATRAFWLGFALFGWCYLVGTLIPPIEARLMTTKALTSLDSKVSGRSATIYTVISSGTGSGSPSNQIQRIALSTVGNSLTTSSPGRVNVWDVATGRLVGGWGGTTENFVRIGNSLFALLAGWIGGLLARRLLRADTAECNTGHSRLY
jgi:hypothetical protein